MDIFTADELAADAIKTEDQTPSDNQEQEQQPADQGPARDEHGRFASKAPEEGKTEPDGKPEPEQRPQDRTVEHGALHQERERRKEAENKWKSAQQQLDAIAQLRQRVAGQQQQSQAEQPPKIETNGQPADESGLEYLRQQVSQLQQRDQQRNQQENFATIDQHEQQTLGNALVEAEAEFVKVQPDYVEAAHFLANGRAQELRLYGIPPGQIQATLAEEALDITRAAIQQGRSPAELAYEVAKYRGYAPKQQQNGNGATAMIDAINAGQKTKSLGSGGGTGGAGEINAQTLANMDEAEFAALYSTPDGKRLIDSLS